jgi:hypothetical protein
MTSVNKSTEIVKQIPLQERVSLRAGNVRVRATARGPPKRNTPKMPILTPFLKIYINSKYLYFYFKLKIILKLYILFTNVVYQRATHITKRRTFPKFPTLPL